MGTDELYDKRKSLRLSNGNGCMPPSEGGKKPRDLEARCNGNRANIGVLDGSYGRYLEGTCYCKLSGGKQDPDCPFAEHEVIKDPETEKTVKIFDTVDVRIGKKECREFIKCTYTD